METEGHVLRSLSVGHTARNQNFVSIGHLRVENFAAGVDVEALHDRIGRQLDEPAENDSIAQRRIDPRRVRGADRDADRASGVAGATLRPVTMPRASTETVCGEEERNVTPSGLPSMSYAVSFASPSWRMRSVGR